MKFRYYVVTLWNGEVAGTNDDDKALDLAQSEECFVIDSESGEWLLADGKSEEIKKEGD